MSITKPYTFSAGTKARANEVNDNFDTVYSQVNANISRIDAVEFDITELEGNKADVNGDPSQRFQVADAINDNDAINKRTLENLIYNTRDYINGLTITKDNDNTIIVSKGSCYSSDYETMMVLASNTSKQNSSQGANTTYYVHLISNDSGTSSDILISQTKISPPLPEGYTKYRNIGNYTTDSDGDILNINNPYSNVSYDKLINTIIPDYANKVNISYSSGDKVGFRGWLQVYVYNNSNNGTSWCDINGVRVASCTGGSDNGIPAQDSNMVAVGTDDVVTFSGSGRTFIKIPFGE